MTLEINIVTQRNDHALLVPSSAVTDGQVWTVRDGRAHRVPVKLGVIGAAQSEVVAGLTAGEPVIVAPPAGLSEGRRVHPGR